MPLSCGVWPASSVPCFRGALRSAWAGTGLGADPGYMDALYRHLSDIYGEEVRPTASLFDGLQNADFFVTVSGLVKEVATLLSKTAFWLGYDGVPNIWRLFSPGTCAS